MRQLDDVCIKSVASVTRPDFTGYLVGSQAEEQIKVGQCSNSFSILVFVVLTKGGSSNRGLQRRNAYYEALATPLFSNENKWKCALAYPSTFLLRHAQLDVHNILPQADENHGSTKGGVNGITVLVSFG